MKVTYRQSKYAELWCTFGVVLCTELKFEFSEK